MFTGIIETTGIVKKLTSENSNLHITISSTITDELKIDQSVAHNGVCLTVVAIKDNEYVVTAIEETLNKTNINSLKINEEVNLERAMLLGSRLDGHIVQGHVDQTAKCIEINNREGSWIFTFEYDQSLGNLTIEKGSITIDGTSLTVVNSGINTFSVAIIPYTLEHTKFKHYNLDTIVNLEFDVIGKYVKKISQNNI